MTTISANPSDIPKNSDWVYKKLETMRRLANTNAQQAQDDLWQWIKDLGQQDNQTALGLIFAEGIVENPKVKTLGMPVGPMRNVPGGLLVSAFLKIDSPWTGKTFFSDGSGGYNRIKSYTKIPVSILAPFHHLRKEGEEYIGFTFDTAIKTGAVEPKIDVLAIEYAEPKYKDPSKIIPLTRVRDELVQILPHTYLGRATFPDAAGNYQLVGYFALKRPVNTEV